MWDSQIRPASCLAWHRAAWLGVLLAAFWQLPVRAGDQTEKRAARSPGTEQLIILYPDDGMTVFDPDGVIEVHLIIAPPGRLKPKQRVDLLMNGRPVKRTHGNAFVLRNVKSGMHRLRAKIVAPAGQTIAESQPVRFYKWQTTAQAIPLNKLRAP